MVAVDLNGDDKLDLATANYGTSTVGVLLNQGTAGAALQASSFAAAVSYAFDGGASPYHLVAADLNGDGKQDLAVAGYGARGGRATWAMATARCRRPPATRSAATPIGITAGDFNGDGLTDLATANYYGNSVTILLGNAVKPLPVDATTGLASGYGRGNLVSTSDADYFSWTGKAGDVVQVASENPGNPAATGLYYQIENASGNR